MKWWKIGKPNKRELRTARKRKEVLQSLMDSYQQILRDENYAV